MFLVIIIISIINIIKGDIIFYLHQEFRYLNALQAK